MKTKLLLTLAALALPLSARAEFSTWTSKDGRKAELELVRVTESNGEKAGEFRMKNGHSVTIKASDLGEADAKRLEPPASKEIPKDSPFASILTKHLVKMKGEKLASHKLDKVPKYVAFYFSAHWCPPCRAFTPKLVEFYNTNHKEDSPFEVVFVSSDRSEADMKTYMTEAKMPWPAIQYEKIKQAGEVNKLCGNGIPSLVLVDLSGKVVKDCYENGQYVGPGVVVAELEKLLKE